MAEETDTRGNLNIKHKRKNSRFLSCFGFSDRDDQYLPELNVCDDRKKTRRWFSSAKLRLKNSVKETIAVYNPPIFKKIDGSKRQINEVRYDNFTGKGRSPLSLDCKTVKFAAISTLLSYDQTLNLDGKLGKKKYGNTGKNILGPGKLQTNTFERSEMLVDETKTGYQCDFSVKKSGREMVKNSSQLRNSLGLSKKFGDESTGKFGPMVGMSILVVIMAMMLLWGKISAIFYTASWLYFLHYYRMTGGNIMKEIERKGSNSVNIMRSIDSKESKKRALLEGLTEKKHMWSLK